MQGMQNDMAGGGGCWEKMKTEFVRKKDKKERRKSLKSGLKTGLERFKNQKFSCPGEGDTPSPGPHPPQPRPYGPRRVSSALKDKNEN